MKPKEIRAAFVLAEVTIKSIAIKLGLSTAALHQVINNQRPNPHIRQAIAEAIGYPVDVVWPSKPRPDDQPFFKAQI